MPIVTVKMLRGRTKEQKAELAKTITEAMERIAKAKPERTTVVFEEVERESWAVGGTLMSEQTS